MTTRVYVGRLTRDVRERDLERLFRGYGEVREILLKNGYGFVEFRDWKDADDVVRDFNGRDFMGDRLIVELARGDRRGNNNGGSSKNSRYGPPVRTQYRVVVENLSSSVSWQDLKDFFRQAGDVSFADVNSRRNEGVVEFTNYDDMKNALRKLDDTELRGRRVILREDSGRGGGSGGGGGRRSRSRSPGYRQDRDRRRSRSRSRGERSRGERSRSRSRSREYREERSRSRKRESPEPRRDVIEE